MRVHTYSHFHFFTEYPRNCPLSTAEERKNQQYPGSHKPPKTWSNTEDSRSISVSTRARSVGCANIKNFNLRSVYVVGICGSNISSRLNTSTNSLKRCFTQVPETTVCTQGRERDILRFHGDSDLKNFDDISLTRIILRKRWKTLKSLLFPAYDCVSSKMGA